MNNDSISSLSNNILSQNYLQNNIPEASINLINEPVIEVIYVSDSNSPKNVTLECADKSVISENTILNTELISCTNG